MSSTEQVKKWRIANKEQANESARQYKAANPLKVAYWTQKDNARRRNIEFSLTFNDWVTWWGDDINKRGTGPLDICMARLGDTGPYALDNIKKLTMAENTREALL